MPNCVVAAFRRPRIRSGTPVPPMARFRYTNVLEGAIAWKFSI